MISASKLIKASYFAGKSLFCPPKVVSVRNPVDMAVMVPIRSLGAGHSDRILQHLLKLDPADRYLRFGYAASDVQIQRYVTSIHFERDEIFGIYNRRLELIAMAHLAFAVKSDFTSCAEFGVSVTARARGRGYGARLFDRAVMHARNEGVHMIFIHALSQNTNMLNIARNAGAIVQRDGSDSEAYLRLAPADLDSQMSEFVEEHVARTDYQLKVQAHQFWNFLHLLQDVRRGVQDARKRTAN
ncbi:MAG: GNAT family N-acetyltransferase [Polaromonas sp.]|nr:GNAT family N-acetyltransferase [Polaromonas sp.]